MARMMLSVCWLLKSLMMVLLYVAADSNGLRIKLIHRDSPESPLYPGNISWSERIQRLPQQAITYSHRFAAAAITSEIKGNDSKSIVNPAFIRPRMDVQGLMYMVEVGIGAFDSRSTPYYKYYLHIDTGSSLTWTQCEDCRRMAGGQCFRQKQPLFPSTRSRTYSNLPCGRHHLCYPGKCIKDRCSYQLSYADNASSMGFLAQESFTFCSDKNGAETIKNFVFGCGINNRGFIESSSTNQIAGTFGMGQEKISILNQLRSLTQGRFSYCLPPLDDARRPHFLRFGADIPQRKGFNVTPLLPKLASMELYYVILKGISIGNKRLDIPPTIFARKENGLGGCIIDSGSSVTLFPKMVYNILEKTLVNNFLKLRYRRVGRKGDFNLCFLKMDNRGLRDLPSITFHLQDANLVLQPETTYLLFNKGSRQQHFCLAMIPFQVDGMIIIGAFQQTNKRFIFDTVQSKLYFGPEDCTRGG